MPIPETLFLIAWLGSGAAALILGLISVRLAGRRIRATNPSRVATVSPVDLAHDAPLAA